MTRMIRATDFYLLTQCNRQVYLDYHGDPSKRVQISGYTEWVIRQGIEFEHEIVESRYRVERPDYQYYDLQSGFQATLELMQRGVDAIYQGVLIDSDLVGVPDLLVRVPESSRFGAFSYRPLDIKTSSTSSLGQRLQVMTYIALLEALQDTRVDGTLLLRLPPSEQSNGTQYREEPVPFEEDVFTHNLAEVRALVAGSEPRPFYSSTCASCGWQQVCKPAVEATQDASLIPGLRRTVWDELHIRGMGTLSGVANAPRDVLVGIKGVGDKTAEYLIRQAQAQHSGKAIHIAPPQLIRSADAIFFDIESLPGEALYYLMGTAIRHNDHLDFQYEIARSAAEEARMWDSFLDRIDCTECAVYHYGGYERTSIKRLMERYGEDPRATRLLDRLIDLERILKDSAALPLKGYSLKDVAPWLGFEWKGTTKDADSSIMEYLHWLEDGDPTHLDSILRYNEDDCYATVAIYDWLISLTD
jgi:predicted RecB family nuclease